MSSNMASSSRLARQALTSLRSSLPARVVRAGSSRAPSVSSSAVLRTVPSSSTSSIRFASSSSSTSTSEDPTLPRAVELIEKGTAALEEGDLEEARKWYLQSVEVKGTTGGWYNLGVCEYHLNNQAKAIEAWEKSIELEPSSDALTNLASAYVMSKPPQPALAIKHLTAALKLAPNDPEIAFNLAAILESTDNLEPALKLYEKALEGGIERASQNVRSISAKILTKKAAAGSTASAPAS